jgi:hypothetical protein
VGDPIIMKLTFKKRLAKEWLTLLGCLVFGMAVFPGLLTCIFGVLLLPDPPGLVARLRDAYAAIPEVLFIQPRPFAWLVVLLPYGLCQLVRSVRWAIRTLRQ